MLFNSLFIIFSFISYEFHHNPKIHIAISKPITIPTGIRIAVFTWITPTTARVIQVPIITVTIIPKIKFFICSNLLQSKYHPSHSVNISLVTPFLYFSLMAFSFSFELT